MGIFDIFNKGDKSDEAMPNQPKKNIENEKRDGNPVAGKSPVNTRPASVWPKPGCGINDLFAAQKLKVFIDSSFLAGDNGSRFVDAWQELKQNQNNARFLFITEYEKENAQSLNINIPGADNLRIMAGKSAVECFERMKEQELLWNVVWLTADGEKGIEAQNAAKMNGIFLRWYGADGDGKIISLYKPENGQVRENAPKKEVKKPFMTAGEIVKVNKVTAPPSKSPAAGALVYASKNGVCYKLREPLMTDHTSITYRTDDDGFYAKIYTQQARMVDVFENKAKLMLKEDVNIKGVCWPKDILADEKGGFMGILVPASRGVQLTRSIFAGEAALKQNFGRWNRIDICKLAYTIIDMMCKVHRLGVSFGCFNPASVYVASPEEVYFVDSDCWQIEGFPVMSRNITFTPPELLSEEKKLRLYSQDEENYQVALLCFMLMLPGKYPYAKRKSSQEFDSLRDRSFPFSIGNDMRRASDAERPSGVWQIVWDHLPYRMCDSFYNTFHPNGKYSKHGARLKDGVWLHLLEDFIKYLSLEENAASRELFPYTFRRDTKRTFVRCSICGKEHPTFYFLRSIRIGNEKINIWDKGYRVCLPCAVDKSDASFVCKACGREFFYTNRTKIMHEIGKLDFDWNNQKWCRDCKKRTVKCSKCGGDVPLYQIREFEDKTKGLRSKVCTTCFSEMIEEAKRKREAVYSRQVCRQCGSYFDITYGEAEYFKERGMNLPTRCKSCRGRR